MSGVQIRFALQSIRHAHLRFIVARNHIKITEFQFRYSSVVAKSGKDFRKHSYIVQFRLCSDYPGLHDPIVWEKFPRVSTRMEHAFPYIRNLKLLPMVNTEPDGLKGTSPAVFANDVLRWLAGTVVDKQFKFRKLTLILAAIPMLRKKTSNDEHLIMWANHQHAKLRSFECIVTILNLSIS